MLEQLAPRYRVSIKTEIPSQTFERLPDTCTALHGKVDAGCIQKNFIEIDVERSFQNLADFYSTRAERLASETLWLKENEIDLVLCDAASLPLKAGRQANLPALLVTNFTWHDIYSAFPNADAHTHLLGYLQDEYASASRLILPQCCVPNAIAVPKEEVGFISLKGSDLRERLERTLEVRLDNKTVVFIYLGLAESTQVQWQHLQQLTDCFFITRDPLPGSACPGNLAVLDESFLFPDLIASANVVLTKAGYATLATAFTHGKPVLSCARDDFCEFEAMKHFLETEQVGLIIPSEDFYTCRWGEWIQKANKIQVEGKVRLNGAAEIAQIVDRTLKK